MTEEQEHQSDLMWALKVLNGNGDKADSAAHAAWLLRKLAANGATPAIRRAAQKKVKIYKTLCMSRLVNENCRY